VGSIVYDCCSVEKKVMQKGWRKIMIYLIARIGRHTGCASVVGKGGIYRMQYIEFSNDRRETMISRNAFFY
jgi:hypothetical protein